MYVIRSYKEISNNKYVGAKIVDENTLQFMEKPWDELKSIIKNNKNAIKNLEIDSHGKLRLVNMNPKHRIRYYNRVYKDGFIIDQYCIITGYSCGRVSYIADSVDGVIGNNTVN